MREPRAKQRFPEGGKALYELIRSDHEPVLIEIFIEQEATRERLKCPDTLSIHRDFDPMLFFWPVEGQHCVVHMRTVDEKAAKRLAKALLRDGADWVTALLGESHYTIKHWGDADVFWRRRYGTDCPVGTVAVPGEGSRPD